MKIEQRKGVKEEMKKGRNKLREKVKGEEVCMYEIRKESIKVVMRLSQIRSYAEDMARVVFHTTGQLFSTALHLQ